MGEQNIIRCTAIIDGVKCDGELTPRRKQNGKDPCTCPKCGRQYQSYASLQKAKPAAASKITRMPRKQAKAGNTLFSFAQNGATDTDNIDIPELETVYEAVPKTAKHDDLKGLWSDKTPDSFGLYLKDISKLLSGEAERLSAAGFILGGIDFNQQKFAKKDALVDIRSRSIQALIMSGKTFTQSEIDDVRRGEEERVAAESFAIGLAQSEQAPFCLSYHFASGVMIEEQSAEFERAGVLTEKFLNSTPPSPERLYKAIRAKRLADSLSHKRGNSYTQQCVTDYDDFWKSICSEICNKEYGGRSYWIASGADWAIGEYAAEVLKTAFACGFSVTPVVSLEQLCAIFERSHNYLNDLEFIHNSPKTLRDTLEQFSYYNQAYKAIYEGAVTAFKPKPPPPYRFTYRAYAESDVVIVTLPSVGLIAGGAHVLTELINARSVAGLSTIIISMRSVRELNELNAGFIPEFFGKSGASLITRKDADYFENSGVSNYVYFSIYGDVSERSAVQKKTKCIADRQE